MLLVVSCMISPFECALAQTAHQGMNMAVNTLLVAQLDSKQVVGGSSSRATGTGAFLLDPVQHALSYRLTYEGLQAGAPKRIALSNFGKGKNGEVVKVLCGADAEPCPNSNSATIAGHLGGNDGGLVNNHLIGEFDSQRIYVEVIGGNGEREIRGQLAPNGAMVLVANYVADLTAIKGSDSKATGTGIMSEVYLPGGKVSVFYAATVAGTSGPPVNAGLVVGGRPDTRHFTPRMALPKPQLLSNREDTTGGSLQGRFDVNSADPDALFAKRLLSTGKGEVGMVITTSRFPDGEVFGTLVPVH